MESTMREKETCLTTDRGSIPTEQSNRLRLQHLIESVATPAVRVEFDKQFHPDVLQRTIRQGKMLHNKNITKEQRDLLEPKAGNVSSSTFDITLMTVFFRNIAKLSIGKQLPLVIDTSTAADLTRIVFYRNKSAHDSMETNDIQDFEKAYNVISEAVVRLGGERFRGQCKKLRFQRLDANLPPAIKDIQEHTIDEWSKIDNKLVVMTSAIETLKDKIQNEDTVTVIGFSGSGKSTAVRNVALRLSREQKYQIFPVLSPKDLMTYYIKGKRQLFVFDDVCGKYSLDIHKLMEWKDLSMDIRLLFGDGLLKCLFTCRPHIFNDSQFKGVDILSSIEHDILSPQYNLSNNERILIAKSHLCFEEVETIKRMSVFNKYDCLPLLCQFYSTNRNSNIVSFFNNPIQVIEDDLISFKHAPDQTTFSVLSLFVIYNNKIDRNDIKSRRFSEILSEISDNVRTSSALSRKVVTDNLTKLSNTYVRILKDSYSIIHDKWFDTVVSFYGKHMFDIILRLSHPDIIRDRYQFEINQRYQSKDSLVIFVPMEKESDYMKRLCKDINDGYVQKVFTNKQLQYLTFRLKFIEQLRLKSNLKRNVRAFQDVSPLLVVSQQNYLDIMEALLEIKVVANVMNKFGTTPLFIASENDQVGMVKLLLTYKCDPNQRRGLKNGETPLHVASEKGHKQVVKLLIRHNANTNICSTNQETPLYIATSKGFIDIVEILLENGSDPNICGNRNFPIFIASRLGHTEAVRLLLESNSDPNLLSEDIMHEGQSPLCIASKYGHTEIVKLLLEHRADSNLRAKDGLFPLYIASREGFTNIVKLLLDFKANQDMIVHFKTNKRQAMLFFRIEIKNRFSALCCFRKGICRYCHVITPR
ncbi:uncharacterized protein LOC127711727 [Mytilus californianus]|uniref:uncharacterized protein LOC127711727 n=1 Tax=Mytilus californianus TaxID=6549 RepID=UPI0022450541|nr:uncharacterized protein LOC127711727 [Mytilus californianus]